MHFVFDIHSKYLRSRFTKMTRVEDYYTEEQSQIPSFTEIKLHSSVVVYYFSRSWKIQFVQATCLGYKKNRSKYTFSKYFSSILVASTKPRVIFRFLTEAPGFIGVKNYSGKLIILIFCL